MNNAPDGETRDASPASGARWATHLVACQQAIYRSYHALDARDYAGVVAEFAHEGIWHRQGAVLAGRESIRRELEKRPANRRSAHLLHAPLVEFPGEGEALASYHLTAYSHDSDADEPGPLATPLMIALQEDRMRLDEQGRWRIEERHVRVLYKR